MEYFEIFLPRMMLSRRAAEFLHCSFALVINNTRLLWAARPVGCASV